jgi:hypothetical protein
MSLLQLLSHRHSRACDRRRSRAFRPRLHPTLEGLELRTVLSSPGALAPVHATTINMLPQLTNTVSLAGTTFNVTSALGGASTTQSLGLSSSPNAADPTCPILNLQLGPIHLNLLGLHVDTSAICLKVTAHQGGGLLGDLLCGLSNALNTGTLSTFLGSLTSTNLSTLTSGLGSLINGALGAVTTTAAPGSVAGASTPSVLGSSPGACNILNLSLGPVDLNLLGLEVHLDNCHNGPVTVDVTAVPSGGLLGQLLCNLDNVLAGSASTRAIDNQLSHIASQIAALV